jgi:hypothetical protein
MSDHLRYVSGTLDGGVRIMAVGAGPLRERIVEAYRKIAPAFVIGERVGQPLAGELRRLFVRMAGGSGVPDTIRALSDREVALRDSEHQRAA